MPTQIEAYDSAISRIKIRNGDKKGTITVLLTPSSPLLFLQEKISSLLKIPKGMQILWLEDGTIVDIRDEFKEIWKLIPADKVLIVRDVSTEDDDEQRLRQQILASREAIESEAKANVCEEITQPVDITREAKESKAMANVCEEITQSADVTRICCTTPVPPSPAPTIECLFVEEEKQKETFSCAICMEEIELDHVFRPSSCKCEFCRECCQGHLRSQLDAPNNKVFLPCPLCREPMIPGDCELVLTHEETKKMSVASRERGLLTMKDRRFCLTPNCEYVCVREINEGQPTQLACPTCKASWCLACERAWGKCLCRERIRQHYDHIMARQMAETHYEEHLENQRAIAVALGKDPDQYIEEQKLSMESFIGGSIVAPKFDREQGEIINDNKMNEYLAANSRETKRCPKCYVAIFKNKGCPHMTCRCGYEFWWPSLKPYRDAKGRISYEK